MVPQGTGKWSTTTRAHKGVYWQVRVAQVQDTQGRQEVGDIGTSAARADVKASGHRQGPKQQDRAIGTIKAAAGPNLGLVRAGARQGSRTAAGARQGPGRGPPPWIVRSAVDQQR